MVNLRSDVGEYSLQDKIAYKRVSGNLQLTQVAKLQDWLPYPGDTPLETGEALWGKIELTNFTSEFFFFTFIIANPTLDKVDMHLMGGRDRINRSLIMGAERAYFGRDWQHRQFLIKDKIGPLERQTLYFRIVDRGPLILPLSLLSAPEFERQEQQDLLLIGLVCGALLILAFYFLISYVIKHSPARFWLALACLSFLSLFMTIEGLVGQWIPPLSIIVVNLSLVFTALCLFTLAKVSFQLLRDVPSFWRYLAYTLSYVLLLCAIMFDDYQKIIMALNIAGASVILHFLLAWLHSDKRHGRPNRYYGFGWSAVCIGALLEGAGFLLRIPQLMDAGLYLTLLMLLGILLIAVAVEMHEQAVEASRRKVQTNTIENLRRFYHQFQNSNEGLYTSTSTGKLITANPAMCKLFGYADEQEMLQQCVSVDSLYAKPSDRDKLLKELEQNQTLSDWEFLGIRADGCEFWCSLSVQMRKEHGETFLYGSVTDISESKSSDEQLRYVANHDTLTGILNRHAFEIQLKRALAKAKEKGSPLCLLYMDIDRFKMINEVGGHHVGDQFIAQVSIQLKELVAETGLLARLGADEFALLLEGQQANPGLSHSVANQIIELTRGFRFCWEEQVFTTGMSIGMVDNCLWVANSEQLMSQASSACNLAKEKGRNQLCIYSKQDSQVNRYEKELMWVEQIKTAFSENKFVLHFQHCHPLNQLVEEHCYEILLRLQLDDGEVALPGSFMPAAENFGLSAQIDEWVVENCFAWLRDNPEHLQCLSRIAINLSGHSLGDKRLQRAIRMAFETYAIPPEKVCFEITESMAINKMDEARQFILDFKRLGCLFALDDFGTGFSSYQYLKNLPADFLKIDGSLIVNLQQDKVNKAMVRSIRQVAKALGIKTIAEFVEDTSVMVELGKLGIDYAQGNGVALPKPVSEFEPFINN